MARPKKKSGEKKAVRKGTGMCDLERYCLVVVVLYSKLTVFIASYILHTPGIRAYHFKLF